MKKYILLTSVLLFSIAAGPTFHGKVVTEKDDFSNAVVSRLKLIHKSDEIAFLFPTRMDTSYTKEIFQEGPLPLKVSFTLRISGSRLLADMKQNVFIKVDGESYQAKLGQVNILVFSETDQTGVTHTYSKYSSNFIMPEDVDQKISRAKELAYRFYIGGGTYTFRIEKNKRQFGLVKDLYNPKK